MQQLKRVLVFDFKREIQNACFVLCWRADKLAT